MNIQSNPAAVEALVARLAITSYTKLNESRMILAHAIRLSMQYPQTYAIPMEQLLPDDQPLDNIAQYVHPFNVATVLANVCVSGIRFEGDNLEMPEGLQVYGGEWQPIGAYAFPLVHIAPPLIESVPDNVVPIKEVLSPVVEQLVAEVDAEQAAETPAQVTHRSAPLPTPDINAERTGASGRPQKSPFEKKVEERNKVAAAPFWWTSIMRSAPRVFTANPAQALDDSSTGAGPVQSYMMLVDLLQKCLHGVDPYTTVADLRTFLREVDAQVTASPHGEAINQLRRELSHT